MLYRFVFSLYTICFCYYLSVSQDSLSLDGKWEILFDEKNVGYDMEWMNPDSFELHSDRRDIEVPRAWETIRKDYEGIAFYQKKIQIPDSWADRIIRLQFDAVNYLSEVWFNNEVVGFHEGGFTPFEFRVDEMCKPGEVNVITVRVVGPLVFSDQEIDGFRKMETPQWRGGISGGIWQSVRMIATGLTYVDDVYIEPDVDNNTTTFHISLDHTAINRTDIDLAINIYSETIPSRPVAQLDLSRMVQPGVNEEKRTLEIPNPSYWSPDDPYLYRAEVVVKRHGEVSDRWSASFGLRELTIKDKDFYLNGEPIYIKAAFFEGLYPNSIAYPDSEEMAREEIRLAKEAGFNMIRPWRHPPAPMWLDLADEMGVMVVGSPALECMTLPLSTPYLPARVENEIRQSVLRDRNRACLVQWELFNELHRPVLKQLMRPMAMLTRSLDPTRLILDESGGWAFGANMYLPYEFEPTKFNDIHNYAGAFINKNKYDGYLSIGLTQEEKDKRGLKGRTPGRNVVPGLMSYVSELGYGSLPDLISINRIFESQGNPLTPAYRYHQSLHKGQIRVLKESGFAALYPDMRQFYLDQQEIHGSANKRMIEAVRSNPEVDGYCIHALVAGDWIMGAGLLDLWRRPKSYAYQGTKAANQPRITSIRATPRNIYAADGFELQITGVNDLKKIDGKLWIEIESAKGKKVFRQELDTEWQQGVSSLFEANLQTRSWRGRHTIKAKIETDEGEVITENSYAIDVFRERDLRPPRSRISVLDMESPLAEYLETQGLNPIPFTSEIDEGTPVFVAGLDARNEAQSIKDVHEFVRNGGTVVFLDGLPSEAERQSLYPFTAQVYPAQGLWTCIPHLVHDHAVFSGLPVNGPMRDLYENVWATHTLRDLESIDKVAVRTVVGSIGFQWFSREHELQYLGPGDAWWGSDLAEFSIGDGRCIVSQLRLIENLGIDPVADRILKNLVEYLSNRTR